MRYDKTIRDLFGARAERGPLFSCWSHFPADDLDAERLAEATVALQRDLDLDFVKTAPNGMYAVEDFGVEIDFSQVPLGGVARLAATPFQTVDDWARLAEPDLDRGALGRELRSLKLLRAALPPGVPIIFTMFSPMTIAAKLSENRVRAQIAAGEGLDAIRTALGRLARVMHDYAGAVIAAGADGIFFAHQDTGRHLFTGDDFDEFVAPYDLEVLAGAVAGRFNVLHLHGDDIRFRAVQDYPVHALNWHSWETLPTAAAGALSSGKCVLGGIDRRSVTANDLPAIRRQITESLTRINGAGELIVTPSCGIRAGFDPETIVAMRDFVRGFTFDADGTPVPPAPQS